MSNLPVHRARKRFGQNFLHDQSVIERIVQSISPQSTDRLVEIGPGLGALTLPLLREAGRLEVVELDRDLIPHLREMATGSGQLTIHAADALKFDFGSLMADGEKLRLVGNLPYNISTPLIFHLLATAKSIHDMHFMLQLEVVQRMAAAPGSKAYGRLSVMCQYYCRVQPLFTVKPGAFSPPPKVDSAIVRLTPYAEPPVEVGSLEIFSQIVQLAFAQRRKTLRNNLKGVLDDAQIIACGIEPEIRAERLTLSQFADLARSCV